MTVVELKTGLSDTGDLGSVEFRHGRMVSNPIEMMSFLFFVTDLCGRDRSKPTSVLSEEKETV